MAKERISSYVQRQTRLRLEKAAETLGISISKYIEQAVETDLDNIHIRVQTDEARKQRDAFKAKYEQATEALAAAEAKIAALENRGLLARIFNRPVTANRDWGTPPLPITPTPKDE